MSFSKECADFNRPIFDKENIQAADLSTTYTAQRNTKYDGLHSLINLILILSFWITSALGESSY